MWVQLCWEELRRCYGSMPGQQVFSSSSAEQADHIVIGTGQKLTVSAAMGVAVQGAAPTTSAQATRSDADTI